MSISDARLLGDGSPVRVGGVLTTDLGAIDSNRIGFLQDPGDGMAIRLDAPLSTALPAGTRVAINGTLGSYFSLRVVNVAASAIEVLGTETALPDPLGSTTGGASEALEGIRLAVEGTVTETPSALADGLGVTIDDGSGPLRIVVGGLALAGRSIGTGDRVAAVGPLGQRDSSGTGLSGYRLHATLAGELVAAAVPSPTPSPTPSLSPTPAPTSTPGPTTTPTGTPAPTGGPSASVTPSPTASPTSPAPSPGPTVSIAAARALAIGARVTVGGVVTAEAGRLGTPALLAIQDSTAGIVVRFDGTSPRPRTGTWLDLSGTLAAPYGQLEIRSVSALRVGTPAALPVPTAVDGVSLGEPVEARLVSVDGVAQGRPVKSTSGDLTFVVSTTRGPVRITADASAGLSPSSVASGDHLLLTGIAGQRASHKDALDGYRVWVRGSTDLLRLGSSTSSAGPSSSPSSVAGSSAAGAVHSIAVAILAGSGTQTVEGSVTTSASLLDATHRRLIVQDPTAAIEVLLPTGATAPPTGTRIRVTGEVGRAYGAPRIRAATFRRLGSGAVTPLELRVAPGAAHEWRLVLVRGDVAEVHRSGDRWTAELLVGGTRVPIIGLAGAAIPSTAIVPGRTATVRGIVRRPSPSAGDRRFAIVPRSSLDLTIGGAAGEPDAGPGSAGSGGTGATPSGPSPSGGGSSTAAREPTELDLAALAAHVGETVRVGGLVEAVGGDGFRLDDGTAVVAVVLRGAAVDIGGSLVAGDALSATGRVQPDPGGAGTILAVDDPAGIVLVGDLGADSGLDAGEAGSSTQPSVGASPGDGSTTPPTGASVRAGLADPAVPALGAAGIVLVSLASLAVTLLRRERTRRHLSRRIADRLAAIVAGPAALEAVAAAPSAASSPAVLAPAVPIGLAASVGPEGDGSPDQTTGPRAAGLR